jgi:hypothetical protein
MYPFDPCHTPTPDSLFRHLDQRLGQMLAREEAHLPPGERGRLFAWYWGHWGRAALDLLLATGQERFALLLRRSIEGLLAQRDDRLGLVDEHRGRVMPGWGVRVAGRRVNEITVAGLVLLPMAEFALHCGESWVAEAVIEGLAALAQEVRMTPDQTALCLPDTLGGTEVLNHAAVFGAALAHASRLPQAPDRFSALALGLMAHHRRRMWPAGDWHHRVRWCAGSLLAGRPVPRCWPYAASSTGRSGRRAELLWKAAVTIELPVALVETGLASASSLGEVCAGLRQSTLLRSGRVPRSIDPFEVEPLLDGGGSPGWPGGLAAWFQCNNLMLSRQIVSAMRQQPALFPGGWLGPSRTMIMGLAHLMRHRQLGEVLDH